MSIRRITSIFLKSNKFSTCKPAFSGIIFITHSKAAPIKSNTDSKVVLDENMPGFREEGVLGTNYELATGARRHEFLAELRGEEAWEDMRPLIISKLGTKADPIVVSGVDSELYMGCTGFPADSHPITFLTLREHADGLFDRCAECGSVYKITNPDGSMLHSVDKHRDAAFGFYAGSTGQHQMCFYNQNSPAEKVISFSFLGPDDLAHLKAPDGSNEEEVALGKDLQSLSNEIRFMKDELSYMNRRLSRHKQTAESTNSRVFWWAFFQLLLLVAVSLFQISYLRQFFEKRRII
ncbi:Cytochrome c oxidase subunit 5B [Globomyces sp. JEL0801]|nr:Cytochrome c oxidase subunit 5B [Globomyces sp. JEL0801]